jgi:predicted kinase
MYIVFITKFHTELYKLTCLKLSTEQEQAIRSAIINAMKLQLDEVSQLVKLSVEFCYKHNIHVFQY